MKNFYSQICTFALCTLLSSCGTTYKYVQICTAEPVANATAAQKTESGLAYENNDCKVAYFFWGNGGDAGFAFYNKTDQVIHVDLSQTFFVRNGVAYDYYVPSTVTKTTSSSVISAVSTMNGEGYYVSSNAALGAGTGTLEQRNGSVVGASKSASLSVSMGAALYGSQTNTNTASLGHSESVSTEQQPVISIPPKSYRVVSLYSIREQLIYDCDLILYPEQSAHLTYSFENSPLTFSNFITYRVGENENKQTIENSFYISDVANYAIPYITSFAPRKKTCENLLTPKERKNQKYEPNLYDAYLDVNGTDKYYVNYSVFSSSRFYKISDEYWRYVWNVNYKAFTRSGTLSSSFDNSAK